MTDKKHHRSGHFVLLPEPTPEGYRMFTPEELLMFKMGANAANKYYDEMIKLLMEASNIAYNDWGDLDHPINISMRINKLLEQMGIKEWWKE